MGSAASGLKGAGMATFKHWEFKGDYCYYPRRDGAGSDHCQGA